MIEQEKETAMHYNKIENKGRKERQKCIHIKIRQVNNEVKSSLYSHYITQGDMVLDIGVGKGGDLNKYSKYSLTLLYGIDISSIALFHCYTRISELKPDFPVVLRNFNVFGEQLTLNKQFNIINSQFAFHYGFFAQKRLLRGLNNINNLLMDNGLLILTMPSKEEVLRRKNNNMLFNDYYQITFEHNWVDKDFNSNYTFSFPGSVEKCVEPLVCKDYLIQRLQEYDINIIYSANFENYIIERGHGKLRELWKELSDVEKDVVSLYEILVFKKRVKNKYS